MLYGIPRAKFDSNFQLGPNCWGQGFFYKQQILVFLEELSPPQRDYLADEYKCHLFYSTRPRPAYYVVDIDRIKQSYQA